MKGLKIMGIFDVFSFKKQAQLVFTKENFVYILTLAKDAIIDRAKENINGWEKKEQVDTLIRKAIDTLIAKHKVTNKLVLWIVDRIKEAVPSITQLIYDFLKAKIEEL